MLTGGAQQPAWTPLNRAQINSYDEHGYCVLPDVLGPGDLVAVTRACDTHMNEWGPKVQPDFPVNFYANRYTPLLSDPALRSLPTHPSILTAAVQLLRSAVRQLHRSATSVLCCRP